MMGNYPFATMLPASDIGRAKKWYEEKLGLSPTSEEQGGLNYEVGGSRFSVYPSEFAGTNKATAGGFEVDNLDKVVDELASRGVSFEQYDLEYLKTNEKGIAEQEGWKGAFFKDSEGNIIALAEMASS